MARHRIFSAEFKCQIAREFLDGRAGMHGLHFLAFSGEGVGCRVGSVRSPGGASLNPSLRDRSKAKAQENQGFLMVEAGGIENPAESERGKKR